MKLDIMIDSDRFFAGLSNDIRNARKNIFIQAMTFEADDAGYRLCDLLFDSPVNDIRILVDCYIKAMISDKFLYSAANIFKRDLKNEYRRTIQLIQQLNQSGIQVKLTNPLGMLFFLFADRNHKKLIVIDDHIAYIGGINFSDHNFLWHDMMLRIQHEDIAKFLKKDFLLTWSGKNQRAAQSFDGLELLIFDGKSNEQDFEPIFEKISQAKRSIFIESPYLTFPFYEKLRQAQKRGVDINIICPEKNNIRLAQKYTYWEVQRSNISLRLFKDMTHLKAMLIDNTYLIVGSSNFDCFSYSLHPEIVAVIHDTDTVQFFKTHVVQSDRNHSVRWTGRTSKSIGFLQYLMIKAVYLLSVGASRLSGTINGLKIRTAILNRPNKA